MNIDPKDQLRRQWFDHYPDERLALISEISDTCYRAWDTWDNGPEPYGVQLAYLFATIADSAGSWPFSLDTRQSADVLSVPLYSALNTLFHPDHAIWLFINLESNGLPVASCPFCGGRELSEIDVAADEVTVDGVSGEELTEWQCRGACEGRSFWV